MRHSWRFSYTQGKISSNDKNSDAPARKQRGFSFENEIKELSAGLEFNFFLILTYTRADGLLRQIRSHWFKLFQI